MTLSLLILKLEVFGKNLKSLISDDPETDAKQTEDQFDKGTDATLSVHLSVMNQKIKVVQLFKGYSSMLNVVWSLPTRMTSLFDMNYLANDQIEYLVLQNGLLLRLENLGVISLDISGYTEISLWSQYFRLNLKKRY